MQKFVNGELVDLTQAEIDDYNARTTAWESQATARQIINYKTALQTILDSKAQEKQYDNSYCCATYTNSTNLTWKAEADAFIAWRDSCWAYCIDIEADVVAEQIQAPTLEDFIANIPTFDWNQI